MISAEDFVGALKKRGILRFTGVPCSFFQAAINCVLDDRELGYTMVPNEGTALSLAAGACLAGASTAVMIQNSGFGNLVNPLTSLNMIYRLPVLLFISGRAYGVPDEPQHEIMGKTMGPVLSAMGVKFQDLPDELSEYHEALDGALTRMEKEKMPFVFFVRKGTVDETYSKKKNSGNHYPLKRMDAIEIICQSLKGDEYVVATTGKPSRELFSVQDRSKNFYMQGSMGHAASFALGVALAQPAKKVVVLDGDGSLLMHMGILSSVGFYRPKNFYHIILDNESYETTGDQDTTSPATDLKTAAKACGYKIADEVKTESALRVKLKSMLKENGPAFLRVKINRLPTLEIPRISTKYTSEMIAENFKSSF